jgi:hypothetical protein
MSLPSTGGSVDDAINFIATESPNKSLGSTKGEDDGGGFTSGADDEVASAYRDDDLADGDLLPLDEQDAEHNWEALNQRILDRMNEEHKWMVQHKIIHPMGAFRKRWDLAQVILLAYVAMLVPCELRLIGARFSLDTLFLDATLASPFPACCCLADRICFDDDANMDEFMFWFDVFVDSYFIIDIGLSFRSKLLPQHSSSIGAVHLLTFFRIVPPTAAYNEPNGDLQFHPSNIAKNYLRTWFVVDVAGCLPINYVLLIMEANAPVKAEEGTVSSGRANRTLRLLRLFRLLKLLRLLRMNRLLKKYEEEFYALKSGLKMVKIGLAVTFSCHWLGCLWYYFGTEEWRDETEVYPDGTAVLPWTQVLWPEVWHNATDPRNADKMTRYVTSVYWSMMTITTVGYGDVHARTLLEKGVSIICMIVGGFIFGLIIGALSDLSRRSNPAQKETNKKIGWLSAYMADRRVPQNLVRSIRAYFNGRYELLTAFADTEYENIFLQLPVDLRLELARQLHYIEPHANQGQEQKPALLSNVPSLGGLDPLSTIMVCSRVKLVTYQKQEYFHGNSSAEHTIFMPGDAGYEMMMVIEGTVHAFSDDGQREDVLKFADYMDEHMMLLPEAAYARRRGAFARTDCSIGLLGSEDLQALRFARPEIDKVVRPYVERARRRRYESKINDVFDALDAEGNGWITFEAFADTVHKRRSYEAGGNAAEVFFHAE